MCNNLETLSAVKPKEVREKHLNPTDDENRGAFSKTDTLQEKQTEGITYRVSLNGYFLHSTQLHLALILQIFVHLLGEVIKIILKEHSNLRMDKLCTEAF